EESIDDVEMQIQVLLHLSQYASDLPIPNVVASTEGTYISTHKLDEGRRCIVYMTTWMPGCQLASYNKIDEKVSINVGLTLGKLDASLKNFEGLVPSSSTLLWDIRNSERL